MRSPQELKQAVDSLFRIRAVESPPDAAGSRRIWHRGTAGAELFTEVDAQGRVVRQELTLFEELVRWDREHGFRRGEVEVQRAEAPVKPEPLDGAARLGRAAGALEGYGGQDRFLQHLREHVVAEVRGSPRLTAAQPITRGAHRVQAELAGARPDGAPARAPGGRLLLVALLAVTLLAAVAALLGWLPGSR
jgi:hypothetical protein